MDADCSLAASLLALDSEAAWELPELAELLSLPELLWEAELLSLPELLWEAELLSPEPAWDVLVLWEELVLVLVLWEEPAVPLEAEPEPAEEAVLSLPEAL